MALSLCLIEHCAKQCFFLNFVLLTSDNFKNDLLSCLLTTLCAKPVLMFRNHWSYMIKNNSLANQQSAQSQHLTDEARQLLDVQTFLYPRRFR